MIKRDGVYFISLPSTIMVGIIMTLIGGYWGDAAASSNALEKIDQNLKRIESIRERTAVIDNKIENIESIVIEIKEDLKEMKNEGN